MEYIQYADDEVCVCCGEYVPEGLMLCPKCDTE